MLLVSKVSRCPEPNRPLPQASSERRVRFCHTGRCRRGKHPAAHTAPFHPRAHRSSGPSRVRSARAAFKESDLYPPPQIRFWAFLFGPPFRQHFSDFQRSRTTGSREPQPGPMLEFLPERVTSRCLFSESRSSFSEVRFPVNCIHISSLLNSVFQFSEFIFPVF